MPTPQSNPETDAGSSLTFQEKLRSVIRHDVPASLVVFLIAIPLSLGIAAASGAPLMAGLVAAVVGGIVAGALGGSILQVSGPAAGLTVVVASMVNQFGWAATAGITCAAGLLQIVLGVTKVGRLALSLSPAVVHGMLAGIGITIAVQQLHVVLGGKSNSSMIANLTELPAQIIAHHPASVVIGALTVVILLAWPKLPKVKIVPAPLVAVVLVTGLAAVLSLELTRVSLPDNPLDELVTPMVPDGGIGSIVLAVFTVAIVASVESLLSAVAVDKLHSGKRSNLDRELVGQGAANAISGALGGMPVTGVIVRSSTNVIAGAKSRASAILHGVWIAVFVLAAGAMLELIPMSALAGVLLVTGLKLVKLAHIRTLRKHYELVVYAITVFGVSFFGLAEGVLAGLAMALVRVLYRLTHTRVDSQEEDGHWTVTVQGTLVFLGIGKLIRVLREIPAGASVRLELEVDYLDHAAFEAIDDWRKGHVDRGGSVHIDEIHRRHYQDALRGEPSRRRAVETVLPRWFAPWQHWQNGHDHELKLVPQKHLDRDPMLLGIQEFEQRSADLVRPFLTQLAADGQRPDQLFVTCADSRIVPNLITSSGPGDLFCVRNVGNLVPHRDSGADDSVGAAVEYAVTVLGVGKIVVCGHSHCGAMNAMLDGYQGMADSALRSWLKHAEQTVVQAAQAPTYYDPCSGERLSRANSLAVTNVLTQLRNLRSYECVRRCEEAGTLELVGMFFDIGAAKAHLVNERAPHLRPAIDPVPAPR